LAGVFLSPSLDKDGIAEFVGAVILRIQFLVHASKRCVVDECEQQVIMAGARLVRAGENRINHAQPGCTVDGSSQRRRRLSG